MGLGAWDCRKCSFQSLCLCLCLCLCLRICNCHCLCICVTLPFLNSCWHELSENVWVWGLETVGSAAFNLWAKCRGWVGGGWTRQTHFMVGPGRGPTKITQFWQSFVTTLTQLWHNFTQLLHNFYTTFTQLLLIFDTSLTQLWHNFYTTLYKIMTQLWHSFDTFFTPWHNNDTTCRQLWDNFGTTLGGYLVTICGA